MAFLVWFWHSKYQTSLHAYETATGPIFLTGMYGLLNGYQFWENLSLLHRCLLVKLKFATAQLTAFSHLTWNESEVVRFTFFIIHSHEKNPTQCKGTLTVTRFTYTIMCYVVYVCACVDHMNTPHKLPSSSSVHPITALLLTSLTWELCTSRSSHTPPTLFNLNNSCCWNVVNCFMNSLL